ncbi:hypothetical protein M758_12G125500 [Ceratodon purpureus]|nr:hypothetical protein M758_12G125500 [Ceratodon purpureus]
MGSALGDSRALGAAAVTALLLMWAASGGLALAEYDCHATSDAISALQSDGNVTVQHSPGIGYGFLGLKEDLPFLGGGGNVTRGVVIVPEDGVAPEAYAPLARGLAVRGSYAVIVEKACAGRILRAMMQKSHLQYWTLAGHGRGGALAAQVARTLQPKVKGLVLMAAPMPPDVDMADLNVIVVVLYGQKDNVVTSKAVEESFSRMPGDSGVTHFPNLGHYDFASSECVGNGKGLDEKRRLDPMDQDFGTIVSQIFTAIALSQWAVASEKALTFFDNEKLTPGHNVSKVYPGDIRVHCTQVPIPNTSPQRSWWVFTPTEIKGGLVYYPGAAVDARAYFPLAFEIAARGHLVVIVQMPTRIASVAYQDANTVIASEHPLFSGVPKGKWALGGHSAGGFATTQYVGKFGDRIYAAVMHAGGWGANLTENPLPIANIYGTLDDLTPGGYDRYRYRNTDPPPKGQGPLVNLKTSRFVAIEGANHYQVGDYGYQSPDQIPIISMEQQVAEFARETVSFLDDVASGKVLQRNKQQSETASL